MNLWSRLRTLARGRDPGATEPEDPIVALERAYDREIEALDALRRAIADVFASEKRLEIECDRIERGRARARAIASDARARDDDRAARAALDRAAEGADRIREFLGEIAAMRVQREALQLTADEIAAHVAALRSQKSALGARLAVSRATSRVANLAPLDVSEPEGARWLPDDPRV